MRWRHDPQRLAAEAGAVGVVAIGAVSVTGGVVGRLSQPTSAAIAAATETANTIERGVMFLTGDFILISWFQ